MQPGEIVADRFEIEFRAGEGAMGAVYCARDRETGEFVALKLLHAPASELAPRLEREAIALAELDHPAIVRHVAHGTDALGSPYLALAWITGETLESRLSRGPLSLGDCVAVGVRVADALAVAHAHGVVHRDIKPANVLLRDADPRDAVVLDFGAARLHSASRVLTLPGALVGTPCYMSPEQARGDAVIDARADLFALGAVLFECATGREAFEGPSISAILAKIMVEDPPRLRELVPDASPELDALIHALLEKDMANRPAHARDVADALRLMAVPTSPRVPAMTEPAVGLTSAEQRVVSVVWASVQSPATRGDGEGPATLVDGEVHRRALAPVVEPFGARVECLADGAVLAILDHTGPASDQAAQAARCALALRSVLPGLSLALATGRGVVTSRLLLGEVIDRVTNSANRVPAGSIEIDATTAGLLDGRFEVGSRDGMRILVVERDRAFASRVALGRASPCVGREREIEALDDAFRDAVMHPRPRVVLITGPAGVGKSRLRYEFVRRLASREEPVTVLLGRGDSIGVGSPFGLLTGALRRACGIRAGDSATENIPLLRGRLAQHLSGSALRHATEFLGEWMGAATSEGASDELRAARQDTMRMGDQVSAAWLTFLSAECQAKPVVLFLEDLQWGDVPSVKIVDAALARLRHVPLLVIGMARDEVDAALPDLWSEHDVTRIAVPGLSRRDAEQLVRSVLRDSATPPVVRDIIERADGNPFVLEELIRAVAEGRAGGVPDTILGMLQSRFDALDPEARRTLRAAAVFGWSFHVGGVALLLGAADDTASAERQLETLCANDLIDRRQGRSQNPRLQRYAFRHALIRDAAYATLTRSDQQLGHRLAGQWLEEHDDHDPAVLAEHFERGNLGARAVRWYQIAAAHALEGNDFARVFACAERGEACGAKGPALGVFRVLQADAHRWRGEAPATLACGLDAMELFEVGSARWLQAVGRVSGASLMTGDLAQLVALANALLRLWPTSLPSASLLAVMGGVATHLLLIGNVALGDVLLARVASVPESAWSVPAAAGWIYWARGTRALIAGDSDQGLAMFQSAVTSFENASDLRNACVRRDNVGTVLLQRGEFEQAELAWRDSLATAERLGLRLVAAIVRSNLGMVLARRGMFDAAIELHRTTLEIFRSMSNRRYAAGALIYLALTHHLAGDLAGAEREARLAAEHANGAPVMLCYARAVLARILVATGRTPEALEHALASYQMLESMGEIEEGEATVHLALAEAQYASGNVAVACVAINRARDLVRARAARIGDPTTRAGFLTRFAEHRTILALADAWLAT